MTGNKNVGFGLKPIEMPLSSVLIAAAIIAVTIAMAVLITTEAPSHDFTVSSEELAKENVVVKDLFVLEYIPEGNIVIAGPLLKKGTATVMAASNSYTVTEKEGVVLPPPSEFKIIKVTGKW